MVDACSTATQTSRLVAPGRTSGCENDVVRSLMRIVPIPPRLRVGFMAVGYRDDSPQVVQSTNIPPGSVYFGNVHLETSLKRDADGESRSIDGSERIRNRADFGTQDALLTNCYLRACGKDQFNAHRIATQSAVERNQEGADDGKQEHTSRQPIGRQDSVVWQ